MTARHLMAALIMAVLFCPPLMAQDNPLVQRGVPAEATADNAVTARDRAHASARRLAFQRLAETLGVTANPSDAQLENMVAALIVEEERTTPTRYSGRLTVQFSPGQVASVTGRSLPGGASGGAGMALNIPMAAQSFMEASSQFNSFQEWLELRRRLRASGTVASMDIIAISPDSARFRLGLRSQATEAAASLMATGLNVSTVGGQWQVGLGGG
ncbi:MAG: hypothetical protein JWR10_790 [Rubritepida sp.]|nr:hypothetical protein [Rubritepida sp.]